MLWKRIPHYWAFVAEYTGHQYISPRKRQDISCFVVARLNKLLKSRFVASQWVEMIWCSWHHCNIISYPNGVDLVLTLPFVTIWQLNLHCNCMVPSENWYVFSDYILNILQLMWGSGSRRWDLRIPDLQMSCSDNTWKCGTRIVVRALSTRVTCPYTQRQ